MKYFQIIICLFLLYGNVKSQDCYGIYYTLVTKSSEDSTTLANYLEKSNSGYIRQSGKEFVSDEPVYICDDTYVVHFSESDSLFFDALNLEQYKIKDTEFIIVNKQSTYNPSKEYLKSRNRDFTPHIDSTKDINGVECILIKSDTKKYWVTPELPFINHQFDKVVLPGMVLEYATSTVIENQIMDIIVILKPKKQLCPERFEYLKDKYRSIKYPDSRISGDSIYKTKFKDSDFVLLNTIIDSEAEKRLQRFKENNHGKQTMFNDKFIIVGKFIYDINNKRLFEYTWDNLFVELSLKQGRFSRSEDISWRFTGKSKFINGYKCSEVNIFSERNKDGINIFTSDEFPSCPEHQFPNDLPGFVMEYVLYYTGDVTDTIKITTDLEKIKMDKYFVHDIDRLTSDPLLYPKNNLKVPKDVDEKLVSKINLTMHGHLKFISPISYIRNIYDPKINLEAVENLQYSLNSATIFEFTTNENNTLDYRRGKSDSTQFQIKIEDIKGVQKITEIKDLTEDGPRYSIQGDTIFYNNYEYYVFEKNNRIVKEFEQDNTLSSKYTYNESGLLLSIEHFKYHIKSNYYYNAKGQLKTKTQERENEDSSTIEYEYDSNGLLYKSTEVRNDNIINGEYRFGISKIDLGYEVISVSKIDEEELVTIYEYDERLNLVKKEEKRAGQGKNTWKWEIDYK